MSTDRIGVYMRPSQELVGKIKDIFWDYEVQEHLDFILLEKRAYSCRTEIDRYGFNEAPPLRALPEVVRYTFRRCLTWRQAEYLEEEGALTELRARYEDELRWFIEDHEKRNAMEGTSCRDSIAMTN